MKTRWLTLATLLLGVWCAPQGPEFKDLSDDSVGHIASTAKTGSVVTMTKTNRRMRTIARQELGRRWPEIFPIYTKKLRDYVLSEPAGEESKRQQGDALLDMLFLGIEQGQHQAAWTFLKDFNILQTSKSPQWFQSLAEPLITLLADGTKPHEYEEDLDDYRDKIKESLAHLTASTQWTPSLYMRFLGLFPEWRRFPAGVPSFLLEQQIQAKETQLDGGTPDPVLRKLLNILPEYPSAEQIKAIDTVTIETLGHLLEERPVWSNEQQQSLPVIYRNLVDSMVHLLESAGYKVTPDGDLSLDGKVIPLRHSHSSIQTEMEAESTPDSVNKAFL